MSSFTLFFEATKKEQAEKGLAKENKLVVPTSLEVLSESEKLVVEI